MTRGLFKRVVVATSIAGTAAAMSLGVTTMVLAHDEIESSVPADRSQIEDAISEVTINFGEAVANVEMAIVDPDDNDLPGEVSVLSDTEAKLTFDEIDQQGQYIVRFIAEENGHLVAGAISFTYGSPGGGFDVVTWGLFGLAAVAILGTGAVFSLRAARKPTTEFADATAE